MNSLKYDILYINTLACAIFLLYKKSVKIIHIHEILVNRLQIIIFGAIIKHFANVAIFVSNACQEKLKPYCKKSIVIHNGVRDIYYKDGFKKENDDDKIRCILIGRIMPEKGYWILADCISEMSSDDRQELEIMTVGSPPPTRPYLKDEFIDYLIKKGIDKNIKVLDFNPHIEDLINSADIVLVPSVMRDPFPTTVIEAMSAAKAVITTDGGGAMEIIKNKSNGIIIRRNNYADLLDALLYLINNRDIIRYLGENARETYKNDLCYESFRKRYSESILSSLSELLK